MVLVRKGLTVQKMKMSPPSNVQRAPIEVVVVEQNLTTASLAQPVISVTNLVFLARMTYASGDFSALKVSLILSLSLVQRVITVKLRLPRPKMTRTKVAKSAQLVPSLQLCI